MLAFIAISHHADRLAIAHVADGLAHNRRAVRQLADRNGDDRATGIGGDQGVLAVERRKTAWSGSAPGPSRRNTRPTAPAIRQRASEGFCPDRADWRACGRSPPDP